MTSDPVSPRVAGRPRRLTICLWDFSWYTRAAPGESFHDLDTAFEETVSRGFTTVRICAMPFLLAHPEVDGHERLDIRSLGGGVGVRTRWYDSRGGYSITPRSRLHALLESARRHGVTVILSSWEWQQSPAFSASPDWSDAVHATPDHERAAAAASAMADLLDDLRTQGLLDVVSYVEVHNEVDNCSLFPRQDGSHYKRFARELTEAVDVVRRRHPDVLVTASIGEPWVLEMDDLPRNFQVAHLHTYVYGVLGALGAELGLGHGSEPRPGDPFPTPFLAAMLRHDAPAFEDYLPSKGWRLEATGIPRELLYVHDWVDPDRWDLWLYEHYAEHRLGMRSTLDQWVEALARWAARAGVPAVVGEGHLGYTPRDSWFEDGPVGKDLCEHVVQRCIEHGVWGVVPCSNASPAHPMWREQAWLRRLNDRFLAG